jgi:hypothetical protein
VILILEFIVSSFRKVLKTIPKVVVFQGEEMSHVFEVVTEMGVIISEYIPGEAASRGKKLRWMQLYGATANQIRL